MAETEPKKPALDTPAEVMRRAYGTKLESLRRNELERLCQIHGIQHGDLIKDDLVRLLQGYEAMGYDLWKRPEQQPPPKFTWPGAAPQVIPTPSNPIEGTGTGRTTSESLEASHGEAMARAAAERAQYEPPPEHAPEPIPSDLGPQDVDPDEWPELQGLGFPQLRALVKALGLQQTNTDRRGDLTVNIMAHTPRHKVSEWIAENVENQDAS